MATPLIQAEAKQARDLDTQHRAAVALGLLGDKDELPRLTLIQMNSNYRAAPGSLAEIFTIN